MYHPVQRLPKYMLHRIARYSCKADTLESSRAELAQTHIIPCEDDTNTRYPVHTPHFVQTRAVSCDANPPTRDTRHLVRGVSYR